MNRRREWVLLVGIFAVLIVLTIVTAQQQAQSGTDDLIQGSTYANGERGARALYLWLDGMGYEVERYEDGAYDFSGVEGVMWILEPQFVTIEEAEHLAQWVERGGTLIWIDPFTSALSDAMQLQEEQSSDNALYPTVPWFHSRLNGSSFTRYVLPEQAVPLMADGNGSVGALWMSYGEGEVWLFTDANPFHNVSLRDGENSAFVEGLLAQLPKAAVHYFDEVHHGFGSLGGDTNRGLLYAMVRAPWGWGLLYALFVAGGWIVLRGAFRRPIPLPNEHLRREAGEYVQGMAWLYRRSHLRTPILRHYAARLKRRITDRYRLPLTADNGAFLAALARVRPDVDIQALAVHLRDLESQNPSERKMQSLVEANQHWMERLMND